MSRPGVLNLSSAGTNSASGFASYVLVSKFPSNSILLLDGDNLFAVAGNPGERSQALRQRPQSRVAPLLSHSC